MPCTYDESPQEKAARQAARDDKMIKAAVEKTYEPLLCSACRALERLGYDFGENPELDKWWDNHKKEDRKKDQKAQAAARRSELVDQLVRKPLADLSEAEKKILREEGLI